jgi:hypothetical protein
MVVHKTVAAFCFTGRDLLETERGSDTISNDRRPAAEYVAHLGVKRSHRHKSQQRAEEME